MKMFFFYCPFIFLVNSLINILIKFKITNYIKITRIMTMKNKLFKIWFFIFISITIWCYGGYDNNNILIRSYYDSDKPLNYESLPFSLYAGYHFNPYLKAGIALGKRSGENGFYPGGMWGSESFNIFESAGFYVECSGLERIKTFIVGNYMPVFGLGIIFGKPYPLLLGIPYLELARVGDYLKPVASPYKSLLFEGLALDYSVNEYSLKFFVSWNSFDSSCGDSSYYKYNDNDWDGIPNGDDEDDFTGYDGSWSYAYSCKTELFSSIRGETDYSNEFGRDNRNNLKENVGGFNLSRRTEDSLYGFTCLYSSFNKLIDPYYNFDSHGGDKTGYYFRGDGYLNAGFYFRKRSFAEFFGEIGTSYYRSKSYYDDFDGNRVFSAGAAGGLRKKIGNVGVLIWGLYLPPMFVNPHCQEYPEGERNHYMVLVDTIWYRGVKKFDFWSYYYSEIYNKDDPGLEERGISVNFKLQYPFILRMKFGFNHKLEVTENYYYAPGTLSYRMVDKLSFRKAITDSFYTGFRGEIRYGSPRYAKLSAGYYIGPESGFRNEKFTAGFCLYYYNADSSHFSYVYPYRDRLFRWSFTPSGIYGEGLTGSLKGVIYDLGGFDLGVKIEQRYDFLNKSRNHTSIYAISNYSF